MKTSLLITVALIAFVVSTFTIPMATANPETPYRPVAETTKPAPAREDVASVLKPAEREGEKECPDPFAASYNPETPVRLPGAGENIPFSEIYPPGPLDEGIAAADKALEEGSIDRMSEEIAQSIAAGLRTRFSAVIETKKCAGGNPEGGRDFVAAYVEYAHYVEALYTISSRGTGVNHRSTTAIGMKPPEGPPDCPISR